MSTTVMPAVQYEIRNGGLELMCWARQRPVVRQMREVLAGADRVGTLELDFYTRSVA